MTKVLEVKIGIRRNLILSATRLESTHGCKHPSLDSGATPIGSAGRAPDKNFPNVDNQRTLKENGPKGSNRSRIEPGDLILRRVMLFCHRQLTSIGLSSKAGHITSIPYEQSNCMASPEVFEDPIY